ncbi:MAG: Rossmann-like domain-containing protein [Dehalococcoidia bacterium]
MKVIDELISSLREDAPVQGVYACAFWTGVITRHCGLSSTFTEDHPYHKIVKKAGDLTQKSGIELARQANSDGLLEASIGMATINSLIDFDEERYTKQNVFDILAEKGRDKNVAIIGHYPWIPKLRGIARNLWIIEQSPRDDDLPEEAAEDILPQCDVIGMTGTSLINHTFEHLMELARGKFVVMVGPTSPLSPVLFDWGVDVIGGARVIDQDQAIRSIAEGATFRQVRGVKLVNMSPEDL